MNTRESRTQSTVPNRKPNTVIARETMMNRRRFIPRAALAIVLIYCSLTFAVDYSIFSGYDDEDYNSYGQYKVYGLMDAFDGMGMARYKCLTSSPWQFCENIFVDEYWKYVYPGFDSDRADYSTLTVHCGHAATFKDVWNNEFYFAMQAKNEWQDSLSISSDILRLGETEGYFWSDPYAGYCRYFMALGCNTVAIGPAMYDEGHPTFSRPDLFDEDNSDHADPNKIWKPVMTDGLRMVMGHTDYEYGSIFDQARYGRFKEYYDLGYSIAWSFANTALDAYSNHKPVVVTLGKNIDECKAISNEREFHTSRPEGANKSYFRWWGADRVQNYGGYYVWDGESRTGGTDTGVDETAPLPSVGWVYGSNEAKAADDAALVRYLSAFGVKSTATLYDSGQERATYKIAEERHVSIDRRTDSLLYRDADVLAMAGPSELSQAQCVDRAMSFLVDNKIVAPDEVKVDSVITESYVVAGGDEQGNSGPQVARYTVVLKRNLGELPVLANDADTIRIEIGQNGKIASLISRYKYGRKVNRIESTKAALPNVQQARTMLSAIDGIKSIRAGMLPMSDGTYVPVYEVASVTFPDGLLPRPQITYHRMDTLQIVGGDAAPAGDNYKLESDEMAPGMSK